MSSVQEQGYLTPQAEPFWISLQGRNCQFPNNANGYVYKLDDMRRLRRFLILGLNGGSYYAADEPLGNVSLEFLCRLIDAGRGVEVVQTIKEVSVSRRSDKVEALLLAYAVCARSSNRDTKKAAYAVLSDICTIPMQLFMFIKFCEQESREGTGWGKAHKRAVSKWYTNFAKDPERLARLVTKFRNRENWSHKDVIRLAHTKTRDKALGFVLRYIIKGHDKAREMYILNSDDRNPELAAKIDKVAELIRVFEQAYACTNEQHLCSMIMEHKLSWEQCNSDLLRSKDVWFALLPHMPIEATIRNLGRMTSYGMFADNSEDEQVVLDKMRSVNKIPMEYMEQESAQRVSNEGQDHVPDEVHGELREKRKNVLHPFKILLALVTYKTGRGDKGKLTWVPNRNIVKALDDAFYQAFESVEPTGKKFYLGVDVSGSMSQPVRSSNNIHCATAAAAMMMVTARTEQDCIIKGFSERMVNLEIEPTDTMEEVQEKMSRIYTGRTDITDCAKPMYDAIEHKIKDVDVFVVYTDNETWYGKVHPCEALRQYRQYSERPSAKLIVCGMSASEFSIADQEDPNMLDVVGFDSATPRLIAEFAVDRL